nr:copper chaperone PCu(A)C [uncultured Pseudomonas sp.]
MFRPGVFSLCLMLLVAQVSPIQAAAGQAGSDERQDNGLSARAAWAFPATADSPVSMVFLVLNNRGDRVRVLQSATSPVAERIVLHAAVADLSEDTMRTIEDISIDPESERILAPGGPHLMLFDLRRALEVGQHFPLTLKFRDGESITLDVTVATQAPEHFRH